MNARRMGRTLAVAAALASTAVPAANDLSRDLTSTIALLGLPCGQVISSKRLGENDYLAVCKNGSRYRVYVNEQGRVVAKKQ